MTVEIGVVGAGSWGTAISILLADQGHDVTLWGREPETVAAIAEHRENIPFLPGFTLSPRITATLDLERACANKAFLFLVVPSHVMRPMVARIAPMLGPDTIVVSCAKGIENDTLMTMSDLLQALLPDSLHDNLTYLSGPSFATEVARRYPTSVVIASCNTTSAERVQHLVSCGVFRAYTNDDVIGVEYGGALKNVLAIAAGVLDGLGLGRNTEAAVITRGLYEIAKLAVGRGARPITLLGLSGLGDLVLTCSSDMSRNRSLGRALGQGKPLSSVLGEMHMVAEGVKTAKSAHQLSQQLGIENPIMEQVYRVLYEGHNPEDAVREVMARPLKPELEDLMSLERDYLARSS